MGIRWSCARQFCLKTHVAVCWLWTKWHTSFFHKKMFVASRTDFPSEVRTGSTISIFWEKRKSRASFFMSGSRPKKVWCTTKIRVQRGDPGRKYTLMEGFSSTTTRRHTRKNSMGSFSMFLHTARRVVRSCEQMKIKHKRNCINDFLYYFCFLCFFFYSNT